MKGHVGGGSGVWRIQGALNPLKSKPPYIVSFTYPYVKVLGGVLALLGTECDVQEAP